MPHTRKKIYSYWDILKKRPQPITKLVKETKTYYLGEDGHKYSKELNMFWVK
jgi:hypothetical protein